jgi:nicotinamidase-related amidase
LPGIDDRDSVLDVTTLADDLVIDTPATSGFASGALDLALRAAGCDRLLLAGWASEVLVESTLRAANDRGYECLTVSDALVPFDSWTGERALSSITMSGGIFGAVGSTAAVLAALRVTAEEIVQ